MKNIICVIGTNEVERSIFTVSLANLLMDKNKDIIVGINSDIIKQIKKKYNITLKEV